MALIHSNDVFERQTNGTVFYREGKLNDFPTAKNGVFESWRYNFDSGKQVFRAQDENGDGKIYEKRLVKDIHGVPRWTGWMEIPNAEANGIQAIAVNDRPLQLPNADGAIKLQITPETIDTYSRVEIYNLIQQKIQDNNDRVYTYVKWIDGCKDAIAVLEATFPDGGTVERFYLVEPHPGTIGVQEKAEYFIWGPNSVGKDTWVPIDAPDMRAFVSYPVFDEHATDENFHMKGDGSERAKWNQNIDDLRKEEQTNTERYDEFKVHAADVGEPLSLHISPEERDLWNDATNQKKFPSDATTRYVVQNGMYTPAMEQIQTDAKSQNKKIFDIKTLSLKDGGTLLNNLKPHFDEIELAGNRVDSIQIEWDKLNTNQTFMAFKTSAGYISRKYSTVDTINIEKFSTGRIDDITVQVDDKTKTVAFQNLRVYLYYEVVNAVEIGDVKYKINLLGKEAEPLYNGVPISSLLKEKTINWGDINGILQDQVDLRFYLADMFKGKVNSANASDFRRYDVYKDTIIPSLIQQRDSKFGQQEYVIGDLSNVNVNDAVVSNIESYVLNLISAQRVPFEYKMEIAFVSSFENRVFFETDNPRISPSPSTTGGAFEWNWPGPTAEKFDKIFLKGFGVEHLDHIKFTISWIEYADVVAEAPGYNWTQNAKNYVLNTTDNFDAKIMKNQTTEIGGDSDTIIGGSSDIRITGPLNEWAKSASQKIIDSKEATVGKDNTLEVGGDDIVFAKNFKVEAKDKADINADIISVYKQEIDERYLFKKGGDNSETIAAAILEEARIRTEEDGKLLAAIQAEEAARKQADLDEAEQREFDDLKEVGIRKQEDEKLYAKIAEEAKNTRDQIATEAALRDEADKDEERERIAGDLRLDKRIDDTNAEVTRVEGRFGNYYTKIESDNNYYNKKETYNIADIDGFVQDLEDRKADKGDSYLKDETYNKPEVDALIRSGLAQNTIKVNVTGNMTYDLLPGFYIYQFILQNDAEIYVKGIEIGKEYHFYMDQIDVIHRFAIKNSKHNAVDLNTFDMGNINLAPNTRTVINAIGINDLAEDGLIIKEVIPHVLSTHLSGYRVFVGNIDGTVHNSGKKDKAVNALGRNTGDVYAYKSTGESVVIKSEFVNIAWTQADIGWTLKEKMSGELISSGKIGEDKTVAMTGKWATFQGDLVLDFQPIPTLVRVVLDPIATHMNGKYDRLGGYNELYQPIYEEVATEIIMKDNNPTGWFVWKQSNNIGMTLEAASYAWKFYIETVPTTKGTDGIPELRIYPYIYKRTYQIDYIVDNSPITHNKDLVWFEHITQKGQPDPNKANKIIFVYGPTDSNDPVEIVDVTSNIEVVGMTQGVNQYGYIRVIKEPKAGETATFTLQLASGYSRTFTVNVARPITKFRIAGEAAVDIQLPSGTYTVHKSPSSNVDYEAHIDWDDAPTHTNGKWEVISGGQFLSVVATGNDKTTITAIKKGDAVVRFTPDFDPSKATNFNFHVYVHVAAASIVDPGVIKTSDGYQLYLTWYDKPGGNIILAGELEDVRGEWLVVQPIIPGRASITVQDGYLQISDLPIPIGTEFHEIKIQFTSIDNIFNDKLSPYNGPKVIATIELKVYRNVYWLTFVFENDKNTVGIAGNVPSATSKRQADESIEPTVNFNNGFTMAQSTIDEIKSLPGYVMDPRDPSNGITRFRFNMPYKDTQIKIESKAI